MKGTKKVLTLALIMVMVLLMAIPAMAETVTNATTHTYEAYQIFKGTQAAGDPSLGDVEWGNGVNSATLVTSFANSTYFKGCDTAEKAAKVLAGKAFDSPEALEFAKLAEKAKTTGTAIAAGDNVDMAAGYYLIVDTTTPGDDDAKNPALLQLTGVGNVDINKKYSVPTVEKKISDSENGTYGEATDLNIGDTAYFQITGTLPNNLDDYDTYKYVFHDTLSAGLTCDVTSVKVFVDGVDKTSSFTATLTGQVLEVSIADVKAIPGITIDSNIVLKYTATLNENAVIGNPGNPNEVYIQYSNNPNGAGEGKTTTDKTYAFTFQLNIKKVNESGGDLNGAKFVLKNADGKYAKVENGTLKGWVDSEDDATELVGGSFSVKGLDAGTYTLTETEAPAGYNKIGDITIVITDTIEGEPPTVTVLGGTLNGGAMTTDPDAGTVSGNVVNTKGLTLPETGGIGTTILYVIGGAFIVVSGILLVTKKRVAKEK